jgi:hypothetical protein
VGEYDLYCERLGPGLLAEPVNAITNAAFFVAAWLAWRDARAVGRLDRTTRTLIGLIAAIGAGSALFHTFATAWARLLDELPILVLQLLFLGAYLRRVVGASSWMTAGGVAAYLGLAVYCRGFAHLLNGSLIYLPALIMSFGLGVYHWATQPRFRRSLVQAGAVLVIAIVLRTLDAAVCERFALGTHFLWHLLVAAVAYLSMRALTTATRLR